MRIKKVIRNFKIIQFFNDLVSVSPLHRTAGTRRFPFLPGNIFFKDPFIFLELLSSISPIISVFKVLVFSILENIISWPRYSSLKRFLKSSCKFFLYKNLFLKYLEFIVSMSGRRVSLMAWTNIAGVKGLKSFKGTLANISERYRNDSASCITHYR